MTRAATIGVGRPVLLGGPRPLLLDNAGLVIPDPDPPAGGAFAPGPNGTRRPPNWPFAFSKTPIATAASWAQLVTAFQAVTPTQKANGAVIEVTSDLLNSNQVLTGGPAHVPGEPGILIRPALGTRRTVGSMTIKAHNVVLAGFDIVNSVVGKSQNSTLVNAQSRGVFLWRCRGAVPNSRINLNGMGVSGLVEVVLPRNLNAPTDRLSLYADGACDALDWLLDGCYIGGGVWATTSTPFAAMTLTDVGNGVYSTVVTKAGVLKTIIAGFPTTPRPWSCVLSVRINGAEVWRTVAPFDVAKGGGDIADFARALGLSYTVNLGDQVDLVIEDASTTFPRIDFAAGPSNGTHCDTIQFGTSYTGGLKTGRNGGANVVRDTVLQGSSNCVIHSTIRDDSTWLYEGDWFGRGAATGLGTSLLMGTTAGPQVRLRRDVFSGGLPRMQQVVENLENTYRAALSGLDPSNLVGVTDLPFAPPPEPTIAQLASMWPECPPT